MHRCVYRKYILIYALWIEGRIMYDLDPGKAGFKLHLWAELAGPVSLL